MSHKQAKVDGGKELKNWVKLLTVIKVHTSMSFLPSSFKKNALNFISLQIWEPENCWKMCNNVCTEYNLFSFYQIHLIS